MTHRSSLSLSLGMLAVALSAVVFAGPASAAPAEGGGPQMPSYDEWLKSTTDSQGVPLEQYSNLPLDPGGLTDPLQLITSGLMNLLWGAHYISVTSWLWLLELLLSFSWVDWIVGPIAPMADAIENMLGDLNWIPFAMAVSGLVIGLLFVAGKRSQGWGELALTVTMTMLATGALMNPVTWITGPDGMLEKSQVFAGQVAVDLAGGESGQITDASDASAALNNTVIQQFSDLLLRMPAQEGAFGKPLSGQCDQAYTDILKGADPLDLESSNLRTVVGMCDEAAGAYADSNSMGKIAPLVAYNGGVVVVLALG